MISFISRNLLKDEPCCKFMLKHDIKNGFRQSTRTLSIFFQFNTGRVGNKKLFLN